MIWAPPLLHQGCQEHPVMRPVSLPLASVPPAPRPQTVQQRLSLPRPALYPPMGGGGVKPMHSSQRKQLHDPQTSFEEVI